MVSAYILCTIPSFQTSVHNVMHTHIYKSASIHPTNRACTHARSYTVEANTFSTLPGVRLTYPPTLCTPGGIYLSAMQTARAFWLQIGGGASTIRVQKPAPGSLAEDRGPAPGRGSQACSAASTSRAALCQSASQCAAVLERHGVAQDGIG